ncbi:translocation/assembly module TamB domain-containing protein [Candidatus Palauibacter sp.]|uniref:translocation/assembly module TamB domain-containing protein n=1 Tax=Candidatus Palauibacter sp. TaxID=3101350 RepID=UPI003AF23B8B
MVTRTAVGRDAALALLQDAIESAVNGEVRIGPTISGNMVTHLTVSRFEIRDQDADIFVALDTVRIEYEPLALFRGRLGIRRLHANRVDLQLTQYPDGGWNYERVFDSPPAAASLVPASLARAPDENALSIVLRDVSVASGRVRIRTPWTATLEGAEKARALGEARAGESPWALLETPEGEFDHLYELSDIRGRFPVARLTDPEAPFMIEAENVSGRLLAVRQPLDVTRLSMSLTLGDTARIVVERLETDQTAISGSGWMREGDPLAYAFELDADVVDVRDLRWLPIDLPESGGGPMSIDLYSRGPNLVVDVSDGDFRTGETRLTGDFRLALSQRPRFEDLDVRLAPFDLAHLDPLLGREPVGAGNEGWARGTIRGSGYTDDLGVVADLTLEDREPETPASGLRARGGVAFGDESFGLRGLEVELDRFEPRWARLTGMDVGIDGRVEGRLTLDRAEDGAVAFVGAVEHLTPAGDLSRFSGSGTLDLDGAGVDAAIDANPLSLVLLRPWAPGIELAGAVTGPIRANGTRADLAIAATLESNLGRLTLNGAFDLSSDRLRYDAQFEGADLSLNQWVEGGPASRLAIRGRANGEGIDPATLAATFDLEILPSDVDRAEIYDSRVRFSVADGLLTIDSLFLSSDVGVVAARGSFGLAEGRGGRILFEADAADLSDWDRWFLDEIPGGAAAEAGEALFDSFEAILGSASRQPPTEGLEGRLTTRGAATGRWKDFTLGAVVEVSDARFGSYRAGSLWANVELLDPPGLDILRSQLTATDVELDGRRVDSLSVRLDRPAAAATKADFHARRDSSLEISGRADVTAGEIWSAGLAELRLRLGKLESTLATPARLVYSDSGLVIDGLVLNGQLGRLRAEGQIPAFGEGALDLELFGLRVEQFGYLLSESPFVGGTLGGSARMTGTLTAPEFAGELEVIEPRVRNHTYDALNARFSYSDRQLAGAIDLFDGGERLGRLGGTIATDLSLVEVERRLLDDPLDLDLTGDRLPLALIELAVGGFEAVSGIADTDLTLRGSPRRLRYTGNARLIDGRGWVPAIGVWLTDVGARIAFEGSSVARIDSAYAASDLGGSARARGTVDIARIADARFDLDIDATRFHGVSRNDMSLAVSGEGRLDGSYTQPLLTGDFSLSDGEIRQDEFLRELEIIDLSDPGIASLFEDSQAAGERRILERFRNPFMNNLEISARVALGPDLWLRSPQLEVELVAEGLDVYMDREQDSLYVSGGVDLPRGTYVVEVPPYSRPLRITGGEIQFVGDPGFNPNLDVTAEYRNRTVDGPVVVEAHISGPMRDPRLVLTSNPPMSETDQFCLLAVGTPCYLSADRQLGQRLAQEALLTPLSSGISSALTSTTALSYFNLTSISASGPGGIAATRSVFERTAVEFGWYASNELFVSFWQPLGGGPPRATVEWSFLPSWSVEARAASRFDERLFGLNWGTNLANDRTFRLFLFREWSFGSGPP